MTGLAYGWATGFRFVSNIVKHNAYGIYGNGVGTGNPAIATNFPGRVITGKMRLRKLTMDLNAREIPWQPRGV